MSRATKPGGATRHRFLHLGAAALVVAGCASSLGGALLWHRALVRANGAVVAHEVSDVGSRLSSAVYRDDNLVEASGQLLGHDLVDSEEFQYLVASIDDGPRYPGVTGIGFISYVPAAELTAVLNSIGVEHLVDFPGAGTGPRPFYCVATVAGWAKDAVPLPIIGVDFCSVSWLRQALVDSATSGRDTVVPEKTLGRGFQNEFVLLSPVYRGEPVDAVTRNSDLVGWSGALVDARGLLAASGTGSSDLRDVALYTGRTASPLELIASTRASRGTGVSYAMTTVSADELWTVRAGLPRGFLGLTPTWSGPLLLLFAGFLIVLLLGALGTLLGHSRQMAEEAAGRARRAWERSEARFESLAAGSPIGIMEITGDLVVTYVNPRLEQIAGRPSEELTGRQWMRYLDPDDRVSFLALARSAAAGRKHLTTTIRMVRPSGELRWVRVLSAAATAGGVRVDPDPERDLYVVTVEDISEEVALHEELRHRALHDGLTGLANRTLFLDRLSQALEAAGRSGRMPAVLFLDVDRFKVLNDSLGHATGDQLLVQLADRLSAISRSGETVARLGGDEFALLLPETRGLRAAIRTAQRIIERLRTPFHLADRELVISASIGVSVARAGDQPETVLRQADAAMYRAKDAGRARFAVFDDSLYHRSLEQLTLEADLRRAIDEGQLEVFFQPVVSLDTGLPTGAEALVRWHHPTRGLLRPADFIPAAEESGLIVPLGQWVYRCAMEQVAAWDADPAMPQLQTIAVNLSSQQLRERRLSLQRQQVVHDTGIDRRRICVEVTETVAMDNSPATRRTLDSMHRDGLQIAIDDFGTGYSSLAYLKSLPVTTVKIDRRFVADLGASPESGVIVAVIVDM